MRRVLAAALVVAGLLLGGYTILDDTGDDVGTLTLDSAPTTPDEAAEASAPADVARTESRDATGSGGPGEPPPVPPGVPPRAPSPPPSPAADAPDIGVASARIGDLDVTAPPAPVEIRLPSLGVDARVVPVGVDPDGLMTVPDDVSTVGWYRFGSTPAIGSGTTVLAGHVDDRVQGRGAFFDLRAVDVGATVTVADEDGEQWTWRVTGRRTYDKASLPIDDLYSRDGAPRLVLITCGGDFDRAARSYVSNVVVEAELVS